MPNWVNKPATNMWASCVLLNHDDHNMMTRMMMMMMMMMMIMILIMMNDDATDDVDEDERWKMTCNNDVYFDIILIFSESFTSIDWMANLHISHHWGGQDHDPAPPETMTKVKMLSQVERSVCFFFGVCVCFFGGAGWQSISIHLTFNSLHAILLWISVTVLP